MMRDSRDGYWRMRWLAFVTQSDPPASACSKVISNASRRVVCTSSTRVDVSRNVVFVVAVMMGGGIRTGSDLMVGTGVVLRAGEAIGVGVEVICRPMSLMMTRLRLMSASLEPR